MGQEAIQPKSTKEDLNKLKCPSCGSYKITSTKTVGIAMVLFGIVTLFIIVGALFLIVGIAILISKPTYTCGSCGYKWKKGDVYKSR